uniref:Uncharacterized protein n=1 Tax=Leptocylindrus danicus TaxID=163516 RepID=A0A7S2KZ21_9STRA|mmetsp:Transcript_29187/g.42827  ORF Transcript_29187/g.42827 Transcript_29187/m.42827 type:complete len:292 (+) Transcript_29187:84-959(+)|eukprot:CAMPEP_0116022568 /NCGR_PEP_ID=MMETSP0321-20121206/11063_1 /TAXON_ID=163516 /ORGANISM="Leptocylindrus danicus var. danicus, Strain B650" /LENGTH=291 /DNA_ID=CAMNT_0003493661 /DNA_START=12 /DNA_END=887 /DNA_ORIENTATION=+
MARGAEAKQRRKEAKKEARAAEREEVDSDDDDSTEEEFDTSGAAAGDEVDVTAALEETKKKKKKKAKKEKKAAAAAAPMQVPRAPKKEGIKTLPLVMLILMTGTTLIPALLYAGDWLGAFLQKQHIMGNIGFRLGVGPSPKKRVISFYEKHDPSKLSQVNSIMSKHYGEYPKLVKRLERKYHDYGYFIDWEKDEAPMKLAKDQLMVTYDWFGDQFATHAPRPVKNAYRNAKANITNLYTKGRKIWRKKIWPVLEPYFGVPDAKAAADQKRKDARSSRSGQKRRKSQEFRED